MDDITFCMSDCNKKYCFRHPSNIQDKSIPHSFADFGNTPECEYFGDCTTCKHRYDLEKADYSKGGCIHTNMDGFICAGFADEGTMMWMVGIDPGSGMCEMYEGVRKT